jgi:hypothetical protein
MRASFYAVTVYVDTGDEFHFYGGTTFFTRQRMREIATQGFYYDEPNGNIVWLPAHRIVRIVAELKET